VIRIVTVPLDLSENADRAVEPAAAIARQLDVVLELVVVGSPGLDHGADELELEARASQVAGVPTERVVLSSNNELDALVPYVADTDRLVCMASRGRGRVGDVLAPSLTLALVRDTERPVLVVGPRLRSWPGSVGTIYLGVDEQGVPGSVIDTLGDLARALGSSVTLVHVHDPSGPARQHAPGGLTVDGALERFRTRGLSASALELTGEITKVLAGLPAQVTTCSIVAVTTRVETRLGRVLRGSVTSQLIATSPVPVLVIPARVRHDDAPARNRLAMDRTSCP
jgi:nucleotide-binding universal stress UspA family protein